MPNEKRARGRRKLMGIYALVGGLLKTALGFYFRRIERFGVERVPAEGPVLFASNHPNSLTDAFVVGAAVPRRVHFVATVQLFRLAPVAWLLRRAGVIPINRARDKAQAMRSVLDTFESVYKILEPGGAVGIFPEGITYDDPHLREIKNGTARMALELEARHAGRLGLKIVPMGLNYAAKEKYRSELLVNFGEPIRVADYLEGLESEKRARIRELTEKIEGSLKELILNLPDAGRARVVEGVCRLYLDQLRLGNVIIPRPTGSAAQELELRKAVAAAVDHAFKTREKEARLFAERLRRYENWLERMRLTDRAVRGYVGDGAGALNAAVWAVSAVLAAPAALYGWGHRILPILAVRWAVGRYGNVEKHKAQTSTAAIVAGVPAFGLFYAALIWTVHGRFGWPASLWYAASLPIAGLITHYYIKEAGYFWGSMKGLWTLLRARLAAGRIIGLRKRLIDDIEFHRAAYRETL